MRVVIAPDSFKGFFSAERAAAAMAKGVEQALGTAEIVCVPMADGGEGTLAVILTALRGKEVTVDTFDPLGRPIRAAYGISGTTAFVELTRASGLQLVSEDKRTNEVGLAASTYGTGVLVRQAIAGGAETVYLTLGGSATSDGGYGLLSALGAVFYDREDHPMDGKDASRLGDVQRASLRDAITAVQHVQWHAVTDVSNPLCGLSGAAAVYGPQKGLDGGGVRQRDRELLQWSGMLMQHFPEGDQSIVSRPGMGAAGGAAFALFALPLQIGMTPGAYMVAEMLQLENEIRKADLVVTGEGRTDGQSAFGKVPAAIVELCRKNGKPCAIVSGRLGAGFECLSANHPVHFEEASPQGATLAEIAQCGERWIAEAALRAIRCVR